MARVVLQKLLSVDMSRNVVRRGFDQVGGIVVEAGDAVGLNTPELLLSAYGFDQDLDTAIIRATVIVGMCECRCTHFLLWGRWQGCVFESIVEISPSVGRVMSAGTLPRRLRRMRRGREYQI